MSGPVVYERSTATAGHIAAHLSHCDTRFVPALSSRVDIDDYARKIAIRGTRFEAWSGDALVGLVAAYLDDQRRRDGFITNVSTLQEWTCRGIASQLLRNCIEYATQRHFAGISLDVSNEQSATVRWYSRFGFAIMDVRGSALTMRLNLGDETQK